MASNMRQYYLLALLYQLFSISSGFVSKIVPSKNALLPFHIRPQQPVQRSCFEHGRPQSLVLKAKLWDRLQIEEDEEPMWYLLNCVAGLEMDLLRQCRQRCEGMEDVVKFVVPTEKKTRSHGAKRMVTETKVKYQGYVFAKLRLCPETYEAIQGEWKYR